MTWFKVDDGIHSHRKTVRAGLHAMGLWLIAGAWCSDQLTDGFIPDYMVARLDPSDHEINAKRLVEAGLWIPEEKDGDKGWQFHDWAEHQPSADSVLDKRAEAKARMARVRAERKAARERALTSGSEDVRANTSGTSREVRSTPTRPDPTRPDPVLPTEEPSTQKSSTSGGTAQKRGTRLPDDFEITDEMKRWAKTEAPDVVVALEHANFADYWRAKPGKDGVKLDWLATWRRWMRKAQQDTAGTPSRSATRAPHQPYREEDDRRNDVDYWTKGL